MREGVFEDHPVAGDQAINEEETSNGSRGIHHRIEPSSDGKKVKFCGQKKLKHDPHPKHGDCNPCDGKESGAVVNPSISVNGREDSKKNTKEDGEEDGNEDQFKGRW